MADGKHEGSRCRAVMEICDSDGNCCQTSPDGRGLYNGKYRASGQTDVYSNTTILGNCAQEVISILILIPIITKVTKSIHVISRAAWLVTSSEPNWQPVTRVEMTVISNTNYCFLTNSCRMGCGVDKDHKKHWRNVLLFYTTKAEILATQQKQKFSDS